MDKKRNIRTVVFRESGGSGRKDSVNSNHVRLLNEQINITTWAPVVTIYGYDSVPLLCGPEPVALPLCASKNKATTSLLFCVVRAGRLVIVGWGCSSQGAESPGALLAVHRARVRSNTPF